MMSTSDPTAASTQIDRDLLRKVNDLRRTDNITNWVYLAREYLFLAAAVGITIAVLDRIDAGELSWGWAIPVVLACNLAVGAGQHRLATLTHEAAHYMLFRNRLLNEIASEWFCMYPLLGVTHPYRVQHLGHHQFPNDPDRDPDWTQLQASGHRFAFPMPRGRFLWECLVKQVLWPPKSIRYVLVRALRPIDQGEGSLYRLKKRSAPIVKIAGLVCVLTLMVSLTVGVYRNDADLLLSAAGICWLAGLLFFGFVPQAWFAEYYIRSDLPPRRQACLRLSYYALAWTAIAWLTVTTGRPWWLYYLGLWIVPLGTSFALFMLLRQLVQHGNADQGRFTNTRNFDVHPLIGFAIFPIGNDYHLPHHLFPMVPHYNLCRAHTLLLQVDAYRRRAVLVEGYFFHRTDPPENPTVLELMERKCPTNSTSSLARPAS